MTCAHDDCTQHAVGGTPWCAQHQPGRQGALERITQALKDCERADLTDVADLRLVASVIYRALYAEGDDEAGRRASGPAIPEPEGYTP